MEAAASPLPREESTPPVTNMYLVLKGIRHLDDGLGRASVGQKDVTPAPGSFSAACRRCMRP